MKVLSRILGPLVVTIALVMLGVAFIPPPKVARAQLASAQTWAGTASGTINAVTLTVHNVAALGDLLAVPINFFPSGANTGATTITIALDSGSTLGPVVVQRQVPGAGLAAFIGGEFQSTKIAAVQYDGTQFECTSCVTLVNPGFEQDFSGVVIPSGWLKADGSAVSRTTYPGLFNSITFATTANTTNTNTSVLVPSSTTYQVGWYVGGANVTCNSTIASIPDSTHIVLSANASASGATNLTIGPNAQGDCSTTFNLPNRIGRTTAMVDGSTNITSAYCTNPGSLGANCGSQGSQLSTTNLPAYTPSGTVSSTYNLTSNNLVITAGGSNTPSGGPNQTISGFVTAGPITSVFAGSPQGGTNAAFSNLMPVSLVYKLIKT